METRANFILIGAFTIAGILAALGFFVWLASVQLDRTYATYAISFDDVSGLDPSAEVVFNGLPVGRVIDLRIDPENPGAVRTEVEVDAETPIHVDTVAQIASQGVTGVSYISLSGGTPNAPLLVSTDGAIPVIRSRRSNVQTLMEGAPDLVTQLSVLLDQMQVLTGSENREHVASILENLDGASANFDRALSDVSKITGTVGDAAERFGAFSDRLETMGEAAVGTLEVADAAMGAATATFQEATRILARSDDAVDSAATAFATAEAIMREDVPDLVAELTEAISDLHGRTATVIDGFAGFAPLLTARLTELEGTLAKTDRAFEAVTRASDSLDIMVAEDGTALVTEMRAALAQTRSGLDALGTVMSEDVPAIASDIRGAVASATATIEQVSAGLVSAIDQVDPLVTDARTALQSATRSFDRAGATFDAIDVALTGADATLASARASFEGATDLMKTDLASVLTDIGAASQDMAEVARGIARDVPAITADVRALLARSDATVAQLQRAVASGSPAAVEFARTGLPEIVRLVAQARTLVSTLEGLARRIERDPARFLLDERVPEYRR